MKKLFPFLLLLAVLSLVGACTKKDSAPLIKTQKELISAHVWIGDSITPNVTTTFPIVPAQIAAGLAAASVPRSNKTAALEFKTTNDAIVYARDSISGTLSNPQTTPYTIDETTKKVTFTSVDAFIPVELSVLLATANVVLPKTWDIQTLDDTRLRLYAEVTTNIPITTPLGPANVPILLKIKLSFKK